MENDLCEIKEIVRSLEGENRHLISENQKLKNCLAAKERKLKLEKDEKAKVLFDLETRIKENRELQKNIKDLEKLVQEKETFLRRLEVQIEQFRHEMEKLSQDNTNLRRDFYDCKRSLERANAQVLSSKRAQCKTMKKLQLCINQTEGALNVEQDTCKKIREELDECQEHNRQLKMENVSLEDQIYALQKTINTAREEWEMTQQELMDVKRDYDHYRESIEKMKNQVQHNRSRNHHARNRNGRCGDRRSRKYHHK